MGFNTTIVLLNDALTAVRDDPRFGHNLYDAVLAGAAARFERITVSAGTRSVAAEIVESHHADSLAIVGVGQNRGTVLGTYVGPFADDVLYFRRASIPTREIVLAAMAEELGFRLTRKTR